jgi:hypothetical protein
MSDSNAPFFAQVAILDLYVHSDVSSIPREVLGIILAALRTRPDLSTYFFRSRPNVTWTRTLLTEGFFDNGPEPVARDGGFSLPPWEAQEFLKLIAKNQPEIVIEHVKRVRAHSHYLVVTVKMLRELPAERVEEVLPIILEWLKDPSIPWTLAYESLGLVEVLADGAREQAALALLAILLDPRKSSRIKPLENYVLFGEAESLLPLDDFHRGAFRSAISKVCGIDRIATANLLKEKLILALQIEAQSINDPNFEYSSYWRDGVEHVRNIHRDEYKHFLLDMLRETLEGWDKNGEVALRAVLTHYLVGRHEILRRLALFILGKTGSSFPDLISRELLDRDELSDFGIRHEFSLLLPLGFPFLNSSSQAKLIENIKAGPSAAVLDRMAGWADPEVGSVDEYISGYSKRWIRDRLSMLSAFLNQEDARYLEGLIASTGSPEHPDGVFRESHAYSITEISPVSPDTIRQKTSTELIQFLQEWVPTRDFEEPSQMLSYSALGNVVAEVLLSNIEKYRNEILAIASLRPEYAVSFLNAPMHAEVDHSRLWDIRLGICEALLRLSEIRTDVGNDRHRGWLDFRDSAVRFAKSGIVKDEQVAPVEFWDRIRDILLILVDDPHPFPGHDHPKEGWVGHDDPLTVAINSVRTEALLGVILYARRLALHNRESDHGGSGERSLDASLRRVLERKLDRQHEPSLAMRAVYGMEFVLLYWLDGEWARANVKNIFPMEEDEESAALFVAAWDAYIVSASLYSDIFDFLRPQYERAIGNVSRGLVTSSNLRPVHVLANHLLVEYIHADYEITSVEGQNGLLAKFFQQAPPSARGDGAWALVEMYQHNQATMVEFWNRTRSFWQWRTDNASRSNFSLDYFDEMRAFSALLNHVPDTESIVSLWPLLEALLTYVGQGDHHDRIWSHLQEFLVKSVKRSPLRSIQFYRLMHDRAQVPMWYDHREAREILESAAANIDSRRDAILLIDKLLQSGDPRYKDIIERYVR